VNEHECRPLTRPGSRSTEHNLSLTSLKARLAEEEAVSKLLEAGLDTLAAEMLEEAPDVISRTTSQANGELQLSATRIRGLKIKIQAAEAALRGCSAALTPIAAALDRAVYVERVEAEAAEIDREIKAAVRPSPSSIRCASSSTSPWASCVIVVASIRRTGTAANNLGSDCRRPQRRSRSEMARRHTPWNRYPRTKEGPEPGRPSWWLPTRCPSCGDGRISCAACGRCRKCCRMVQLARQMASGRGSGRPPKGDQAAP